MIGMNRNPINLNQRERDFFWNHSRVNKNHLWFSEKQQHFIVQDEGLKMK